MRTAGEAITAPPPKPGAAARRAFTHTNPAGRVFGAAVRVIAVVSPGAGALPEGCPAELRGAPGLFLTLTRSQ
ncbi:hypothetical protein Smic_78650 [Streptomyces microflavus]|uniref:Uncharacterized protein n=1 Tax=Streptomyces microflavus TaxID=1919 RepID=A0A7J0D493_STRMI|nr:hypothetical protein Smic_78650 [Streptomyces microflavus]